MIAAKMGVGLAAVVAGPPLYALVSDGDIDPATALVRGGVVAAGCVIGAWVIGKVVSRYDLQRARAARLRHEQLVAAALTDAQNAAPDRTDEPRPD